MESVFSVGVPIMSDSKHLSPPAADAEEFVSETMQFLQPADSTPSAAKLFAAGTPLGHYIIKKHIGGGGMGQVYLATDTVLDRDVAIKVLTQKRGSDQGIVDRFMNEARSAARLNHEHIAQVYFAGEESGIPFIAFEYVEGTNVRMMVEEHDVFPLPQALSYLLQIAHALAHAAAHGVIHRDVKPSNILITREGRAKLIDMGLARLQDTSAAQGDLTASGVTLGTFDYISPEQARDPRNADIRSDIYSLGCTFFFMLAGRPPFPEGTVLQKLLQHQGDAPPDIRSFQPAIPSEIAFIIQKMMAKDPKQRFQTPKVLVDALTDAARRLGMRPAGQGNLVWTPTRPHRRSYLLRHIPWIVAVLVLFSGFFLIDLFSRWFEPLPPPDISSYKEPSPTINETISLPIEPTGLDIVFVPHRAARPSPYFAGLGPPVTGGSLRPAAAGITGRLNSFSSGRFSVADLKTTSQNTAAQQINQPSNVRYVDPTDNTIGSYPSLASALTDAGDETTIKLKWNGIFRITEPIRFNQRKLHIVAAEGYTPVLLFEPTESQSDRSFFTVFSSDLEFQHVGIEIRFNPNVAILFWSLFESTGNSQLKFEKCCLTVRNKSSVGDTVYHDDVVFFRNGTPAGTEEINLTERTFSEPLLIEIKDSLLRGEAVAIQSNVSQDINVQLTDSLVALAKPFILVERKRSARQAAIQIRWNGVAFFGREGVVSLYNEAANKPILVKFDSQQSVFVLNSSPFVVFRGLLPSQSVLDDFQWSSGGINYFQCVLGPRFRSASSFLESRTANDLSLTEWQQQYWGQEAIDQTKIDALTFSEIGKPMSQYLPQDVRVLFDLTGSVRLPNLDWLPRRWYGD